MRTHHSGLRWSVVATVLSSSLLLGATACAPPGPGAAADQLDPDVVGVSLSLTIAPADAKCYRATFSSASSPSAPGTSTVFSQTFAPTAGSSAPVVLTGLPTGTFSLLIETMNLVCASVVPTTPLSWTSDPVTVVLTPGVLTPATVTFKRPGATAVSIDYDTSQLVSPQPAGVTGLQDILAIDKLYVARGAQIDRVSLAGGPTEISMPATVTRLTGDSTGLYYSTTVASSAAAPAGLYWIPAGQAQVMISPKIPSQMTPIPGGCIGASATAGVANSGAIDRFLPTGVTPIISGLPSSPPPLLASDGTSVYWAAITTGSSAQMTINKAPVAGGPPGTVPNITLTTLPGGVLATDLATDGAYVYWGQRPTPPGGAAGIYRIPVAGGTPALVTPIASGLPSKVLVDATNVYVLVNLWDNRMACDTSFIYKVPKAGGAGAPLTPLWSKARSCGLLLAQSPTQLYFDVGTNVHRVDK